MNDAGRGREKWNDLLHLHIISGQFQCANVTCNNNFDPYLFTINKAATAENSNANTSSTSTFDIILIYEKNTECFVWQLTNPNHRLTAFPTTNGTVAQAMQSTTNAAVISTVCLVTGPRWSLLNRKNMIARSMNQRRPTKSKEASWGKISY